MGRVILHADANSFYASVECYYHPEYRERPLAVCGDPEARHGIVLAKNQAAKRFHIQTGEAVWQAKQKCPELVVMPPHFDAYQQFSDALQKMYGEYSERVEALGLDECWLDVSNRYCDIREGQRLADEIRMRSMREIGITLSVGVSFNKTFAKLGSDLKKPNGTTVISRQDVAGTVWPLPASDMLMVGPHTMQKLRTMGILTIGDLAMCDPGVEDEALRTLCASACRKLDNLLLPELAIVDPQFTMTAPPRVTVNTGLDALCHAVEAFTSRKAQTMSDTFAVSAVKRIFKNLPTAYKDGKNEEARIEMSIASLEAGIAFNNASVTLIHGMSRPIGALFHIAHGMSNAILMNVCLRFAVSGAYDRFGQLGREIGAASVEDDDKTAAEKFLAALDALTTELDAPTLASAGVDKDEFFGRIDKMAHDAMVSGSPQNTMREMTEDDVKELYKQLW